MAAGPIGRNAEASGTASIKSVAAVYSYSKTRGVFAGVSLEGSVIIERFDANAKMYGRKVATRDLLNGTIPPPPQADPLYRALEVRFHGAGGGNTFASSAAGGRFAFMNGSNDSGFGSGRGLGRSGTMYNTEPVYEDSFRGGNNDRSDYSRGGVHRAATTGGYGGGYSANRGGGGGLGDTYGSSNRSFDDSPSSFRDTTWENRNSNEIRARALFNFSKQQDGDLPFRKGDIITIIKRTDTQHDW